MHTPAYTYKQHHRDQIGISLRSNIRQGIVRSLQGLRQKGSFTRNFAITLSGSALSTVLGILLTPITSRIYAPAVYGQFSLYAAVVTNLNFVTTLTYTNAFLLPKERSAFLDLVRLTVLTSVASCGLLAIVLAVAGPRLMQVMHMQEIGNVFYTLPILLLIVSINNILSSWYIREKEFAKRVGVDLVSNVGSRVFSALYGLFVQSSVTGLLLGEFFNRLANSISLTIGNVRHEFNELWHNVSWNAIRRVAYEYRAFPLFNLPSVYVYIVSTQLPLFMLAPAFGATAVGLYSFSMGLLEMPINVLAAAISPVFQQKAAETYNENPERLADITLSLYNKLLYIGLLPFGFISVYGDLLFKVVFGAKWELAGVVTAYLGYYYVFKLLSLGTGGIYTVLRKQKYALYGSILLLIVRATGLSIGIWLNSLNIALLLFGVGSLMVTFAMDLQVLWMLRVPVLRVALRTIGMVIATLAVLKLVRMGLAYHYSFFAPMVGTI